MNLLANACDAIEEKGNIWVTAKSANGEVRIEVRDDGRGMPPE